MNAIAYGNSYTAIGSASIIAGQLAVGTHNIYPVYSGDTVYQPTTWNQAQNYASITVSQGATTTKITAYPSSAAVGTSYTLTAAVSPPASYSGIFNPIGTVNFYDNGTLIGSPSITGSTASYNYTFSTAGSHPLTAQFVAGGSSDWATSNSPSSAVTATVTQGPTTTVLTSYPSSPAIGISYNLTATVSPPASYSGIFNPIGTVNFYDNGNLIGSPSITGSTASYNYTFSTAGTHQLTADFVAIGSSNWASSNSQMVLANVAQGATTTVLTTYPSSAVIGTSYPLTATVSPTSSYSGTFTVSGTVNFYDNGSQIGSAPISGTTASYNYTFTTAGSHSLTANFVAGGSSNWASSSLSAAVTATVGQGATTTTLTNYPSSVVIGTSYPLTATVSPSSSYSGTFTVSGTVNFYDNGNLIGSAVDLRHDRQL